MRSGDIMICNEIENENENECECSVIGRPRLHSNRISLFNMDFPPCAGLLLPAPCDVPEEKAEYMV